MGCPEEHPIFFFYPNTFTRSSISFLYFLPGAERGMPQGIWAIKLHSLGRCQVCFTSSSISGL